MIWAAPAAWALAVLAVLPLVAHLWSRQRPSAVPFPTLRFLQAASPASRRLRHLQEWPLLLLRVSVVLAICAAAAGPTLASRWRRDAWRARLHRVIVLEDGLGPNASAAVTDLRKTAASFAVLPPAEVVEVLDEAIAQADRSARTQRTELVIVWAGSRHALAGTDVADIPLRVGVRLVPVDAMVRPRGDEQPASAAHAVTIEMPATHSAVRDRLLADAAALRVPPAAVPVHLRWGAQPDAPQSSVPGDCAGSTAPVLRALEDMADDVRLRDAVDRSVLGDRRASRHLDGVGTVLARSSDGVPLLRGWHEGGCLMLDLAAAPTSPSSWWSLVAAREALARIDRPASPERWSAAEVTRANRDAPAAPDSSLPGGLDTRGAWGLALALLLLEQAWRRHRVESRDDVRVVRGDSATTRDPVDAA